MASLGDLIRTFNTDPNAARLLRRQLEVIVEDKARRLINSERDEDLREQLLKRKDDLVMGLLSKILKKAAEGTLRPLEVFGLVAESIKNDFLNLKERIETFELFREKALGLTDRPLEPLTLVEQRECREFIATAHSKGVLTENSQTVIIESIYNRDSLTNIEKTYGIKSASQVRKRNWKKLRKFIRPYLKG